MNRNRLFFWILIYLIFKQLFKYTCVFYHYVDTILNTLLNYTILNTLLNYVDTIFYHHLFLKIQDWAYLPQEVIYKFLRTLKWACTCASSLSISHLLLSVWFKMELPHFIAKICPHQKISVHKAKLLMSYFYSFIVLSYRHVNGASIFTTSGVAARKFQNDVESGLVSWSFLFYVTKSCFSFSKAKFFMWSCLDCAIYLNWLEWKSYSALKWGSRKLLIVSSTKTWKLDI